MSVPLLATHAGDGCAAVTGGEPVFTHGLHLLLPWPARGSLQGVTSSTQDSNSFGPFGRAGELSEGLQEGPGESLRCHVRPRQGWSLSDDGSIVVSHERRTTTGQTSGPVLRGLCRDPKCFRQELPQRGRKVDLCAAVSVCQPCVAPHATEAVQHERDHVKYTRAVGDAVPIINPRAAITRCSALNSHPI